MTPPPYAGHPWGEKKRGVREIKKETDRETAREADYEREKKRDRERERARKRKRARGRLNERGTMGVMSNATIQEHSIPSSTLYNYISQQHWVSFHGSLSKEHVKFKSLCFHPITLVQ